MAATTRERDKDRKESKQRSTKTSHRTKNMRVHFHKDGQICPSTFGEECPNDSDWDGSEEGEAFDGNLSVQDLIQQLAARGSSPGWNRFYYAIILILIFTITNIFQS